MTVNPTASAATATTGAAATSLTTQGGLGQDAFLQLLVTQLKNQDPLQPQDNGEFLAQLAQFSTLEQLQQIGTSLDTMNATLTALKQYAAQAGTQQTTAINSGGTT